jgi:hypothetical protein
MVKTQPIPGRPRALRLPPFNSTFCRAVASPSPRPLRSLAHCVNGKNIFSTSPSGSPPQRSATSIRMRSADVYALKRTSVCGRVKTRLGQWSSRSWCGSRPVTDRSNPEVRTNCAQERCRSRQIDPDCRPLLLQSMRQRNPSGRVPALDVDDFSQ